VCRVLISTKAECSFPIHSGDLVLNLPERVFHLEVMRGGMNRLLLRSNRTSDFRTRIEVFFINVKYMSIGTFFEGLVIERSGPMADRIAWQVGERDEMQTFSLFSTSGQGLIVASDVGTDESDAGPADPSGFFMMD
jgi:hypothetical protein